VKRDRVHAVPQLEELVDDAELVKDLERSGVDPDRARLRRASGLLIEHAYLNAAASQFDGK